MTLGDTKCAVWLLISGQVDLSSNRCIADEDGAEYLVVLQFISMLPCKSFPVQGVVPQGMMNLACGLSLPSMVDPGYQLSHRRTSERRNMKFHIKRKS